MLLEPFDAFEPFDPFEPSKLAYTLEGQIRGVLTPFWRTVDRIELALFITRFQGLRLLDGFDRVLCLLTFWNLNGRDVNETASRWADLLVPEHVSSLYGEASS